MKKITLNTAQARELVGLLDNLSEHVESAIETSLVPATGEPDPGDSIAIENVALDRTLLKRVRQWQRWLLNAGGMARL